MIPTLVSPRLVLRPARAEDADALHAHYRDPDAMRYWSHAPHTDPAQTRATIEGAIRAQTWRLWAVTLAGDDAAIGTLAVGEHRPGVVQIGYSLLRAHGGRGLAREAVVAVLDWLFGAEGLRRVFADIDPDNAPSRRLVEALGFTLEGVLRAEWETHIGVRDTCLYALLATEWRVSS